MSTRKFDRIEQLKSEYISIENWNLNLDNDPILEASIIKQTAPLKQKMKDIEFLLENAHSNCHDFIERLSMKDWQAYQASVRARKSRSKKSRASVKRIEISREQHEKLSALMQKHDLAKYEDALDFLLKSVED